jgi:hypothetical protein
MTTAIILRTNKTQEYIVHKMPGYCMLQQVTDTITSAVLEAALPFLNATPFLCMDFRLLKGKVNSSCKSNVSLSKKSITYVLPRT